MNNIFRCYVCGRHAIFEELNQHECRALKDHKFEEDVIQVFDGKDWYPLNLEKVQRNIAERRGHKRLSGPKSNRKFTDDDSNHGLYGACLMVLFDWWDIEKVFSIGT